MLKWLRAEGCPWDEERCRKTAGGGSLEGLKWLRAEGCPWDEQVGCPVTGCPVVGFPGARRRVMTDAGCRAEPPGYLREHHLTSPERVCDAPLTIAQPPPRAPTASTSRSTPNV